MRRGLTLVETIIALAIIAIAFSILATAFVGNVRVSGTAGEPPSTRSGHQERAKPQRRNQEPTPRPTLMNEAR